LIPVPLMIFGVAAPCGAIVNAIRRAFRVVFLMVLWKMVFEIVVTSCYGAVAPVERRNTMAKQPRERFESKVNRDGPICEKIGTKCHLWTAGTIGRPGYGGFMMRSGYKTTAHRAAYLIYVGPIADGLDVDHLCRVRLCVNPAHLEAVTHLENVRRGEPGARGRHWMKLTPDQVRQIRARRGESCTALGLEFGVTPSAICYVRRGDTWKTVS
jgi:hypothetical protein